MEFTVSLLTPHTSFFFFLPPSKMLQLRVRRRYLLMVIQQQKEARGEVNCIATELLEEQKTEGPCLPPFMQGFIKIA